MTRSSPTIACLILAAFHVATGSSHVTADEPAPKITRLRGIIDRDQTWSGHVLLTGDVSIEQGTVTVEPGTLIEFAGDPKADPPVLTIGSKVLENATIRLRGTQTNPIVIRSRPDTPSGRIVAHLFSKNHQQQDPTSIDTPGSNTPVKWEHVFFSSMGQKTESTKKGRLKWTDGHPSIKIMVCNKHADFSIESCRFEDTSLVSINMIWDANITIQGCQFRRSRDIPSFSIGCTFESAREGRAIIERNFFDGYLFVYGISSVIEANVLVGQIVGIHARGGPDIPSVIRRNYLHSADHVDEESSVWSLINHETDAIIERNVLRSGDSIVGLGSGRLHANAIIYEPQSGGRKSRGGKRLLPPTVLPLGAIVDDNLFLGSSHSMQAIFSSYSPNEPTAPIRFCNNVFDGIEGSSRALQLSANSDALATVEIYNNLFLRVSAIVYDEDRRDDTLLYADYNAVAPPAPRGFDQAVVKGKKPGDDGWGMHDIIADDPRKLGLGPLPDRIPDYDEEILSGRMTIDEVREKIFDLYRPRPGSPLIGAGRKVDDGDAGSATSIGLAPKP